LPIFTEETQIPFTDTDSHEALLRRRQAGPLTWRFGYWRQRHAPFSKCSCICDFAGCFRSRLRTP